MATDHDLALDKKFGESVVTAMSCGPIVFGINKFCKNHFCIFLLTENVLEFS